MAFHLAEDYNIRTRLEVTICYRKMTTS